MTTNPSPSALEWVTSVVGAPVVSVRGLRENAGPWLLGLDGHEHLKEVVLRTGAVGRRDVRLQFETEAAALELAGARDAAAPRLLACDLEGDAAGMLAILSTAIPGSSKVPLVASGERLRALGAAAAALHAMPLAPRQGLPLRTRPIQDVDFAAIRRKRGMSPLLAEAEQALERRRVPARDTGDTVLVHGDLWQGNTMWDCDVLTGIVDWDAAGAGHFGVDLGSLRFDATVFFGPSAADEVVAGWTQAMGRRSSERADVKPEVLAYWDVVAALATPPDMAAVVPAFHAEGRTDLDAALVNERRDVFLRSALERLEGHA